MYGWLYLCGTLHLAGYAYHALGQRSKLTRGNGAVTDFGFDTAQRLTALVHDLPASADDQSYGFGYTPASQVSMQSASNAAYTWSAPAVSGRSYARNGLNQYTSVGGISFTHDARGNLTHDGSRTLGYDLENRLLTVSGPASLNLSYDPAGRLRQSVAGSATTQFLYSGSALVAEYDGAGNVLRRYVHGPGIDEPIVWYEGPAFADPRYLIADRQGSIIATRGASTVRHKYGPYGEPDAWAGSRFRYTGQIALPEAGLYHYKARVYDPALGRFLQTDPVGYADDVNLYAYVYNDPLNRIDSTGHCANCVGAAAGGGFELLVQVAENIAGTREGYSLGDIGIAAVAGATGVGAARSIGRARQLGAIARGFADIAVDSLVSAGAQLGKDGEISGAAIVADVTVGRAIGGPVGERAAAAAARSAEGRVLERQADRATRIASQSDRPGRQMAAAAADAARRDHAAKAAAVAGSTASNLGSTAVSVVCVGTKGSTDCQGAQ